MGTHFFAGLGWLFLAGGFCLLMAWRLKYTALSLLVRAFGEGGFGVALYALLTLPGFFLHEGAHALTAFVLRVPVRDVTFIPRHDIHDLSVSASVQIARRDPLRMTGIALAPLLAGTVALGLLTGTLGLVGQDPRPWMRLQDWAAGLDRHAAGFWGTIYLLWTISSHMAPSRSDMRYVQHGAILLLAVLALAAILLPLLGTTAVEKVGVALSHMGDGLAVGAVLNGAILLPLTILTYLLRR